jgi:hypothetical protein
MSQDNRNFAAILLGILIGGLAGFIFGFCMFLQLCVFECGTNADAASIFFFGSPVFGALVGGAIGANVKTKTSDRRN